MRRIGDHLLEYRTAVIGGGRARLDVLGGEGEATGFAVLAKLAQLIGNGEIVLGLAGGGHPSIERYGHGVIVSEIRVGIDFWRKYPIDKPRKMGSDEFEFAGNQRILG